MPDTEILVELFFQAAQILLRRQHAGHAVEQVGGRQWCRSRRNCAVNLHAGVFLMIAGPMILVTSTGSRFHTAIARLSFEFWGPISGRARPLRNQSYEYSASGV